jgi:hypothetical protein
MEFTMRRSVARGGVVPWFTLLLALPVAAVAATPKAQQPPPAVVAANEWWHAFADGQFSALAARTNLPFRFETTMTRDRTCEGSSDDAKALGEWLKCMTRSHRFLMKVARKARVMDIHVVETENDRGQVHVFGDVLPKAREGEQLVYAYLDGGPVWFLFVVSITGSGSNMVVHDFLVNAEDKEG